MAPAAPNYETPLQQTLGVRLTYKDAEKPPFATTRPFASPRASCGGAAWRARWRSRQRLRGVRSVFPRSAGQLGSAAIPVADDPTHRHCAARRRRGVRDRKSGMDTRKLRLWCDVHWSSGRLCYPVRRRALSRGMAAFRSPPGQLDRTPDRSVSGVRPLE